MRRALIGSVCAIVMLALAAPASAQDPDIFTGRIEKNFAKLFSITTDESMIVEINVIAFAVSADLDILVTTEVTENGVTTDQVVIDSKSGVLQYEQAAAGLLGATTYKVTLSNVTGPESRFALMFSSPGGTGATKGARLAVSEIGSFGIDEPVDDPALAGIQELVRQSRRTKR